MSHFITAPSVTFTHAQLSAPVSLEHEPDADVIALDADGTFRRLWPTSLVLSNFLCDNPSLVVGKRIIELGAGTGAVGLVCAQLGAASVTLTDMPDALGLLARNAARSECSSRVRVAACTWGNAEDIDALLKADGPYDVVLCCEVVYQQTEEVLWALAQTQLALAAPGGKVLLGYEFRGALTTDLEYFEATTQLFGDSVSHALLDDGVAQGLMGQHSDDGSEDRVLYVYSLRA